MVIDPAFVGVAFRQISARLRVDRGPGRPDLVSERARRKLADGSYGNYLDSTAAPTLIVFDEYCQVDIPSLLQIGALQEYTAPALVAEPEPEGGE